LKCKLTVVAPETNAILGYFPFVVPDLYVPAEVVPDVPATYTNPLVDADPDVIAGNIAVDDVTLFVVAGMYNAPLFVGTPVEYAHDVLDSVCIPLTVSFSRPYCPSDADNAVERGSRK
jgi:hypothetical protein